MGIERVKAGYNQIVGVYNRERTRLRTDKYVRKLLTKLPKRAKILDLGCGAGVPVDDLLLRGGYEVWGMDIAEAQIELAKKNCPGAEYRVGDILKLKKGELSAQAIVCMYTMFHLPRGRHLEMLTKMASFVPKGGWLLLTMGDKEFEGEHELFGVKMWSSQWGAIKNRVLVKQAGWEIELEEIDGSGGEQHQIIMAYRI